VDALKDESLVNAMRSLCVASPELNNLYARNSDEEIVKTMLIMKPFLPMIVQLMESKTVPMAKLISMFAQHIPDPNAPITNGKVR